MTKLITAFIIIVVCYCGYKGFVYWESVRDEEENQHKQATGVGIQGESLPGMSQQLEYSYQQTRLQGTAALRAWFKTYGPSLQDPRKAWIELDICVAIARDDPAEARRIFKSVKDRLKPSSPVWPRVKQLEKSYE